MKRIISTLLAIIMAISFGACSLNPNSTGMDISEVLALSDEDLLEAMSEHLNEMCDWGTDVDSLNEYEKVVFYADELSMEVNCGGFYGYLYNCGENFHSAKQAFETIKSEKMLTLLSDVESKFPNNEIPANADSLQVTLDTLDANGINFDDNDDYYYETAEKELLQQLISYIRENETQFR